jgi:CRP/FNR family transcriptional regulator, cyclic AMP receptor protein
LEITKLETPQRTPTEEARRLLGEGSLFRGLVPELRGALAARARIRRFSPGETIFHMGSPGSSMMAVLSGNVRISISSPGGKELLLAILNPGEVFGEIALLDGKERSADATAVNECSLAILERRDVLSFFEHHPEAWPRIVDVLCERLRENTQHVAEVALLQLPARLARTLLREADSEPGSVAGRPSAPIQLSQRDLGNMVGATRESVNKCLGEWQRRGIIRIDDNSITIADRAALEAVVSET